MKISCQACGAKYTIADEKVQGKIAKIRCKRCQATIVVNGPGTAAAEASGGGGGGDAGAGAYTVNFSESDQRTMSIDEIVRAYQQGQITHDTYVWAEGMDDWLPLASVPALASAVAGHASQPDAPPPEAGSVPAARLDGGRVRVDLFGDVSRAGAEPERHDADDMSGTMTGARNEQSVLFSLQTLSGSSGAPKPAAASAGAGTAAADDSGLIDLAALAKAAGETHAAPSAAAMAPPMMPMAQQPLGMPNVIAAPPILGPTMLETPAITGSVAPPPKGKTGLYIVIAAALLGTAVVAGAAIIALTRPPPVPEGVRNGVGVGAAGAAVADPTPLPTTTAADTADTPPPSTAATASATAPKPRPAAPRPPTDRPPTTTAPPAATPPKPTASPNSNCGCPPGDLNCAIKCSATKKK